RQKACRFESVLRCSSLYLTSQCLPPIQLYVYLPSIATNTGRKTKELGTHQRDGRTLLALSSNWAAAMTLQRLRSPARFPRAGALQPGTRRGDAPHDAAHVVGHQQGPLGVHRNADRPTLDLVVGVEEAGEELLRRHLRPAIGEGDEHDPIAIQRLAVPRAVLAHEGAASVRPREGAGAVEGQAQRSGVRPQAIVG